MNVLLMTQITAVLMLTAPTQLDHMIAHVMKDSLEMVSLVKVYVHCFLSIEGLVKLSDGICIMKLFIKCENNVSMELRV